MSFRDSMDHMASASELCCDECQTFPCDCPPSDVYDDAEQDEREAVSAGVHRRIAARERLAFVKARQDGLDMNNALDVALRWSVKYATLETKLDTMAKQLDRLANFVQALPQREEHDAVLADVSVLQEQMRGLNLRRAS